MSDKLSVITYALSKKYTKDTADALGAVKGAPCTIKSITEIEGGHRITFEWTSDSGVKQTNTMDVMDGVDGQDGSKGDTGLGIKAVSVNSSNHLVVTYDDDTTEDAGEIKDVSTSFDKITDVDLSNLTDGQILKYNATSGKWENASAGSVDTNLVDLNDVDVESLTDGQIIVWDATNSKWVNADNEGGASALSDLTDTTITTPSDGEVLVYDGTAGKWVNDEIETAASLSELTDTTITTPADGEVLVYDSTAGKWVNDEIETVTSLSELTDTTISSPSDGQVLAYDATSGKWVNEDNEATVTIDPVPTSGSVNAVSSGGVYDALSSKVDKNGTDRLMTAAEGTKLAGIAANAEVNVQSDWNQTNTDADDFIKNKPTIPDVSNYVQKSSTAGLLKNDGTVDTHTYVATSSTAGLLKNDGTVDTNTYATTSQIPSVTGKADKVTGATNGNFAGLDSNGNLTDSGKKASDFASASDVHSIPSGGTSGQVLAKSSGTDYDVSWVNAAGGGGTALWTSGTTDAVTNIIPVTLSEPPTLKTGNVVCLQIMANYTAQLVMADQSWGLQYIINGYTTNISDCIFEVYSDSSHKVYFNDDLHKGDVLVLVVKEYTSGSKVFVVAAHKTEFEYTEQTVTLSTSSTTTVTFTSNRYTANSTVEVATSDWSVVPDSVTVTSGSCTVTLPAVSSARSIKVRIYNR